jgi:hypothetical protein
LDRGVMCGVRGAASSHLYTYFCKIATTTKITTCRTFKHLKRYILSGEIRSSNQPQERVPCCE